MTEDEITPERQRAAQDLMRTVFDSRRKYWKMIAPVVVDGVVVRRAHWRNYGRPVSGGISLAERIAENIMANNALLGRLGELPTTID